MRGRISILLCIICFLPCIIKAQEINVRVVDDSDGEPVPFCHICIENKESGEQKYIVGDLNGEARVPMGDKVILSVTAIISLLLFLRFVSIHVFFNTAESLVTLSVLVNRSAWSWLSMNP